MDIEKIIQNTTEENQKDVNWTKAWSGKYPVLSTYQNHVDVKRYSQELRRLADSLKDEQGYSEVDAFLVLKDILYHEMNF